MHFFQNKNPNKCKQFGIMQDKKSVARALVGILISVAGVLVIFFVWENVSGNVSVAAADSLCRGNVAFREKAYAEVRLPLPDPIPDPKLGTVAAPIMLCDTTHLELPQNKDDGEEEIKKQFAELMASCWSRYGEGIIADPFKRGDPLKKNCETCYSIRLKETSNYTIQYEPFINYLFTTPYRITSSDDNCRVNGGYCIDSTNKNDCKSNNRFTDVKDEDIDINTDSGVCSKEGHKACCYTGYQCLNRGGVCSAANPDVSKYRQYNEWDCPKDTKCFVKNENYYTYGEYIQRFGGPGNIFVLTDIKPGETYAVSFGSPNIECGFWCNVGKNAGFIAGAGAIVVGAVLLLPSGGSSTVLIVVGITATVGGLTGAELGQQAAQALIKEYSAKELFQRDKNTIYLTTRNAIEKEELCSID